MPGIEMIVTVALFGTIAAGGLATILYITNHLRV